MPRQLMSNKFIFSNQPLHKVSRHLLMWLLFTVYLFVVNFFPRSTGDLTNPVTYLDAFQRLIYLPVSVFAVYISIYFLLPRYILTGKYAMFFLLFFGLCILNLTGSLYLTKLLAYFKNQQPFEQLPLQVRLFQPIVYGLGLSLAASAFSIIVKLMKVRYLKQKENERLLRQKISTELQMIKTNFHPHFLSAALQNIGELIRSNSDQSPAVILKLSDLLSYTLYENDEEAIPIEKEIMMMKDYLDLEKTFYGNRIQIIFSENVGEPGLTIAPLVLLSLVQNCCEQFLISLQQKLSIRIDVRSLDSKIIFGLSCNGYYENVNGVPNQNNELARVLRRIQAIYPGRHSILMNTENGCFSITLILEPIDKVIAESKSIQEGLYEIA